MAKRARRRAAGDLEIDAKGFADALAALIGRPIAATDRFVLAVSGGADSLGMMLLAHAAKMGASVVTVNHGLRAEAADEAAMVAEVCRAREIPHRTLDVTVDRTAASVQAAARDARYAAMARWCDDKGIGWLLTAHHADDQAETLLMRMSRGSGLAGMAGIRARRRMPGFRAELLRPLLGVRKAELVAIVEAAGIDAVDDPSNRDRAYDRTAVRGLLASGAVDAVRASATAAHLAEAEAAIEWTVDEAWAGRAACGERAVDLDVRGLPQEIVRRLVLKAILLVNGDANPDGPSVARLVAGLDAGAAGSLAGVAAEPGRRWRFFPAPARGSASIGRSAAD